MPSFFLIIVMSVYVFMNAMMFLALQRLLGHAPGHAFVLALVVLMGVFSLGSLAAPRVLPDEYLSGFGLTPALLEVAASIAYYWIALITIVTIWSIFAEALHLVLMLVDLISGLKLAPLMRGRAFAALFMLWCAVTFSWALYDASHTGLKHLTIRADNLPEGRDSLRIALLTDIHLSPTIGSKQLGRMVDLTQGEKPDLIIIGGDLVDGNMQDRHEDLHTMRRFDAPLGKYAVLGNHEVYMGLANSLAFIERSGLTLLRGEVAEAGGIVIAGVDDPIAPAPEGGRRIDSPACLKKADQSKYVLLISHRPETPPASLGLFDLQLSGHTHGGQNWPFGIMASYSNGGHPQGLSALPPGLSGNKRSLLYLSNGAGYWGPPIRVGKKPEITIIDLVRG